MNALVALVRKDLILYFSNRRALLVTLAAPIVIASFFGSLFGAKDSEPTRMPIAVVDLDRSVVSQKIVQAMSADAFLDVRTLDASAAIDGVHRGKLRAVVTFPPQFGADAGQAMGGAHDKPVIDIRYDPSQALALQVLHGLLARDVIAVVARGTGDGAGPAPRMTFQMPYAVEETEATSAARTEAKEVDAGYNGYSHAFAGMGVQFILFMGIDLGIKLLNTRRLGLWQRLRAAPLSRAFLLGSQIASGAIIAALLFTLIFASGMLVFGVRIEGSIVGFIGLIAAFALMTATFGLFIAALGRTPEATRGLAVFATLVMVMLGGAWVPAFVFPAWLQTASLAVPTRWAVDGFDAMTWRGLGWDAAWQPILVLLGFALAFGVIAVVRFDWDEHG